jgi:integrase
MANAFFRLRKAVSKKQEMIYLGYKFGQDQLIYSTGVKIMPKHWDFAKSRVKNVVEVFNKDDINNFLKELADFVNSTANTYAAKKLELTKASLKQDIENYLKPPVVEEAIGFFPFIEKFINDLETGKRMLEGNKLANSKTIQRYKTAKNSLLEFEKHEQIKLTFDSWTEELWNNYISYLTFVKKFKINNIGFYQKQLKILLKAARKAKLYTVGEWLDDSKILAENPVDVYLNKKELALIEDHDLSGNDRLDRIRDLFLIGCYTGFRISDWKHVKKENIKTTEEGNQFIEIIPDKANATPPSTILHPTVNRVLDKYGNVLPTISEQKFNEYLKELCKLVGIKDEVTTKYVISGRVKVEKVEKHTQISSHTARRSFATNMYLDGVEPYLIMKATGHASAANFKKYLKLDNSGAVDAIAKHNKKGNDGFTK